MVRAEGQDRRSRHQGHQGPLPGAGQLRGRADAAAHAAAQAQGLHEPVPHRVPGRQPRPARRAVPRGRRRRRRRPRRQAARSARASRSRSSATASSSVALQVTAHTFSASAKDKIAAAGGTPPSSSQPAVVPIGPGLTTDCAGPSGPYPVRVHGPIRPGRASAGRQAAQEELVLTAFGRAFRTPDLRKKLLFTLAIIASTGSARVVPTPGVVLRRRPALHRGRRGRQRALRPDQPVQRRRAAAAVDLRARDHAVHHGEHHLAAARRGHPAARDPQEGGPGGQAKITQYTRYLTIGARDPAVHRHRSRCAPARAAVPAAAPTTIIPDDSLFGIVVDGRRP